MDGAAAMEIEELLAACTRREATDLHLSAGSPPRLRIHGDLLPMDGPPLTPEAAETFARALMSEEHAEWLSAHGAVDFGYTHPEQGRFRVNIFHQYGTVACALRKLMDAIPPLEALHLPQAVGMLADLNQGLVLLTGPTGSGKSTTIAALLNTIILRDPRHVLTIEDPVEYRLPHGAALVNQREVHTDVASFADGLRDALREDPDMILVGEMRDLETVRTAVMASETGHLVYSTLHSRDATSAVERVCGSYPAEEQPAVRQQLGAALRAVVSQRLLKRIDEPGRIPAVEFMLVNSAIAANIRTGRSEQIPSVIETSRRAGMQTMDQSLRELFSAGRISRADAVAGSRNPEAMARQLPVGPQPVMERFR